MTAKLPRFLGPVLTVLLLILIFIGVWFYYCYYKPSRKAKRQREAKRTTPTSEQKTQCRKQRNNRHLDEEEFYSVYPGFPCTAMYFDTYFHCPALSQGEFRTLEFPTRAIETRVKEKDHRTWKYQPKGAGHAKQEKDLPHRNLNVCDTRPVSHHCETIKECEEDDSGIEK